MAGGISDEDIQRVRDATDIVTLFSEYTPVKQRGRDYWCCCPFHQEKTPSCKLDPSTQLWHCFGCGEGGDLFSFVMKHDGVSFPDAVRTLAQRAHIEISSNERGRGVSQSKRALLQEICQESARFFHTQLMRDPSPQAAAAREYLSGRGLGGSVPNDWNLGFAPGNQKLVNHLRGKGFQFNDMVEANVAVSRNGRYQDRFYNRVMFPIRDPQGEVIAFGGRVIGTGEPKYLNSQETPLFHKSRVLYGLDKAKASLTSTGIALITEGYTDVIALHESGITNAVATLGTSLTMNHIRLISRYAQHKIVYLFDGDAAGQKAADRALRFIDESMTPEAGRSKIELCAVTLPDNQDPAEYMASHSADDLRQLVHDAKPLIEYGIERRLAKHDLSSAEGRTAALTDALSILAPIKNSLLAKDYAVQIAGRVRAREDDVLTRLSQLKAPRRFDEDDAPQSGLRGSLTSQQVIPKAPAHPSLSSAEVNRRRFEGELLGLCAQNPLLALAHADSLAQTQWHEDVHSRLAFAMLDSLAANPAITPAELVSRISTDIPLASRILTTSRSASDDEEAMATYLIEELSIGDMEDSISQLRMTLSANDGLDAEEREILFQSIVSMQKTLTDKKRAHKAPVFYE